MLPNTTATMRQSSAVPTTAGITTLMMVDVAGTLLEGVAGTLVVIENTLIVDVVKCVLGDDVSAEYDTVEQFMDVTVPPPA